MRRAHKVLDPAQPAVVVTGSIAEMIGGGVTPEGTNIKRFLPRTIDEDQWQSANRAINWLWTEFGPKKVVAQEAAQGGREAPRQHHRADLRHLQHAVRSRRDPPPRRGYRRRDQPDVPARQRTSPTWPGSPTPTSTSASIANSAGCSASSSTGPICRRRSACIRRPSSCVRWATCTGLDPEPFIEREKHTTIKPLWDLWRSVTQDFFGTASVRGGWRPKPIRTRHPATSSRTEMGLPCSFADRAQARGEDRTTTSVRALCQTRTPLVLFGSFNERMYLAETNARAMFIQAVVPRRRSSAATPARR